VGVSLNTSKLGAVEAAALLAATGDRLGLPCIDPIRIGVAPIVDMLS
jgi:uncharacterized NAD-dependent epimerase/dehydratase family protein